MFGRSKKDLSDKQILKKIQSGSHQNKNAYLFLMPWLIGFLILTIGPFFYTIVLSFYDVAQTGLGYDMTFIGFDNYILAFFTNTSFVPAMIEFITLEITYVPAIIIASFILGTLLNRELKFRSGFRTIFFLPVIVLSGSVMDKLIDTESNRLSDFSENIIFQMVMNYNVDAARALLTLFENFTMVLWFTGIPIILFINGLQKINSQLYEAAKIDGANSWQILWKITVPIIKPTALIVSIFTIVQIGMYNINPVFYLIRDSMYNIAAGLGVASAFTWIYTIVVLIFVGVALLLLGTREKKAEVKLSSIQKLNFERIKLKRDTVVKEVNNG
jgi:oligogalacturonide transport system permease protein